MKLSSNGYTFIKKHEGYSLTWYALNDGGVTVGYGHYVPNATAKKLGIKAGQKITKAKADAFLEQDMAKFEKGTNAMLKQYGFKVNQNQFDALVSYAFNRGLGNSAGTNGLRQLLKNSKSVSDISNNFIKYWGTNTFYKAGLLNRRRAEKVLFDSKSTSTSTSSSSKPATKPTVSAGQIGIVTVKASALNVRSRDSVSSPIVKEGGKNKVLKKGTAWKCYEIGKWGYMIGKGQWVSKAKAYTSYVKV